MHFLLRYILFALLFCSCGRDKTIIVNPDVDQIVRDIPLDKGYWWDGTTNYMYNVYNKRSKILGLDPLYNGFDSLQVRVWLGHSMARVSHVVMLRYTGSGWSAELMEYADSSIMLTETHSFRDTILIHFRKPIMPKSGWRYLLQKLEENDILNLPDGCNIPSYSCGGIDGIEYCFEIATSKVYRFYSYWEPEWQAKKFSQAAKVVSFSSILEKEFGFEFTH